MRLAEGLGIAAKLTATVPVKRPASPEIAAAAVSLASEDADCVHGATLAIDGGRVAA